MDAVTMDDFRNSLYVKQILKAPKHMVIIQTVDIPEEDGWDDLPPRIHKSGVLNGIDANALIGCCIQDEKEERDTRFTPHGKGGKWNWAAINLNTGKGLQLRCSRASGKYTKFDLTPRGQKREAEEHRRAKEERANVRGWEKGKMVYDCGSRHSSDYFVTLEEARRLEKEEGCIMYCDRHGRPCLRGPPDTP